MERTVFFCGSCDRIINRERTGSLRRFWWQYGGGFAGNGRHQVLSEQAVRCMRKLQWAHKQRLFAISLIFPRGGRSSVG